MKLDSRKLYVLTVLSIKNRFFVFLILNKIMFSQPEKIPEELVFDIKSLKEELYNMYSHLFGIVFWLVASPLVFYQVFQLDSWVEIIGMLVYYFSFLMIFSSSALYHSSYEVRKRKFFRTLDHISIYFFIAGSYTPILLFYINNEFGRMVLLGLWSITLVGTIFKIFFVGKFRIISTIIYSLMGWTGVFIVDKLIDLMPTDIFYWIAAGGIIYTIGIFFYLNRKIKFNHFYWHLAVAIGAICHFIAIYLSLVVA